MPLRNLNLFQPQPDATRFQTMFPPTIPRGPESIGPNPDPIGPSFVDDVHTQLGERAEGLWELGKLLPHAIKAMGQGREGDESRELLMGMMGSMGKAILANAVKVSIGVAREGPFDYVKHRVIEHPAQPLFELAEMFPLGRFPAGRPGSKPLWMKTRSEVVHAEKIAIDRAARINVTKRLKNSKTTSRLNPLEAAAGTNGGTLDKNTDWKAMFEELQLQLDMEKRILKQERIRVRGRMETSFDKHARAIEAEIDAGGHIPQDVIDDFLGHEEMTFGSISGRYSNLHDKLTAQKLRFVDEFEPPRLSSDLPEGSFTPDNFRVDQPGLSRLGPDEQATAASLQNAVRRKKPTKLQRAIEAKQNFKSFVDRAKRRDLKDAWGQDLLDDMTDAKMSPKSVSEVFWGKIYPTLPAKVKLYSEKLLARQTGMKPGSVVSTQKMPNGSIKEIRAVSWQDLGEKTSITYGRAADMLEGTERGYIVELWSAIKQFGPKK